MRVMSLLILALLALEASAGAETTTFCIRNTTNMSHHIEVANIENYDWEGDNRPDHNFNNITIEAGQTICRLEDSNEWARPMFTFVIDGIPTRMGTQSDEAAYNSGWGAYSVPSLGIRTNLWGERTFFYFPWNFYKAYDCNIGDCALFEIR